MHEEWRMYFNQQRHSPPKVTIDSWPAKGGGGPLCSKAAPSHFFCCPAQWLPAAVLRWASPPSPLLPPASAQSSPPPPPAFSPSNGLAWRRPPYSLQYPSLNFSNWKKKNSLFLFHKTATDFCFFATRPHCSGWVVWIHHWNLWIFALNVYLLVYLSKVYIYVDIWSTTCLTM